MKIIKSIEEMQKISAEKIGTIGFVPTMGYMHKGHLSLVRNSKKISDITVVSIYVNPTQFAPNEDLSNYPRNLENDFSLLENLDVDYIFLPDNKMMYPQNYKTWVEIDDLTQFLCGKSRPSHFKGVTTIVTKLINCVLPDFMFLGEKDFQQLTVLSKMVKDLNFTVKIVSCPIIREKDGLAMSSRNKNLNKSERNNAICLWNSLQYAKNEFLNGETDFLKVRDQMKKIILSNNGRIDYIDLIDSETLQSIQIMKKDCRLALAVYFGKTRLIDNLELNI
ncbi:MAG: pantoate--beta-alanine ligase [Candidatus Cloacimonetes bacterium]|nr:pantoate--beta-alanine ligase [Candidatus Cloacimonadota bacterium]